MTYVAATQHGDVYAHGEFTGQYSLHGDHQYSGAKRSWKFPGSQLYLELYHRPDSEYHTATSVEHQSDLGSHERARQSENSGNLQRGHGPGNDHRTGNIYRGRGWSGRRRRAGNRHLCAVPQRPLLRPRILRPTRSTQPPSPMPPKTLAATRWRPVPCRIPGASPPVRVPDVTPPTITLTSPANAAINVALNATVNATFSKAMDPVTITAPGTFTVAVSGAGGAAVAGNVTYDSVSHIATFTPAANLTASTQYTATITNAAKDLAGNASGCGNHAESVDLYHRCVRGTHGSQSRCSRNVWEFRRGRWYYQSGNQHDNKWRSRDHRSFHARDRIPRCRSGMYLYGNGKQHRDCQRKHRHGSSASDWSAVRQKEPQPPLRLRRKPPPTRSPHTTIFPPPRGLEALIRAQANSAHWSFLQAYTKPPADRSCSPDRTSRSMAKGIQTPSGYSKWRAHSPWVILEHLAASFWSTEHKPRTCFGR